MFWKQSSREGVTEGLAGRRRGCMLVEDIVGTDRGEDRWSNQCPGLRVSHNAQASRCRELAGRPLRRRCSVRWFLLASGVGGRQSGRLQSPRKVAANETIGASVSRWFLKGGEKTAVVSAAATTGFSRASGVLRKYGGGRSQKIRWSLAFEAEPARHRVATAA